MSGISSHASKRPCPYCVWIKGQNDYEIFEERTFEGIYEINQKRLQENGATKDFLSVKNYPICNKTGPVLNVFSPPSLHLTLGIVNKLYSELKHRSPLAEKWLEVLHIGKKEYHSGILEGKECKKLLKNTKVLENLCVRRSEYKVCQPFITCFEAFHNVISASFGKQMNPNLDEQINSFRESYLRLDISVTTKVHIIFNHLYSYCTRSKGGLWTVSEETHESLHQDFDRRWSLVRVKDSTRETFRNAFSNCVVRYNSNNV
jgi:hypothetical protein